MTKGDRPITAFTLEALTEMLGEWGYPSYRAGQITEWVYRRGAARAQDMGNLPKALRDRIAGELSIRSSAVAADARSEDGTAKLAVALADGNVIETACIPQRRRLTACLSTQVGCAFACAFCESGRAGLVRDLADFEIVEQLLHVQDACGKPTHVVFMGIGEPLANYEALSRAIDRITAAWAFGIGRRRITVSTVGIPDMIRRLAEDHPQVNLALSLHAPEDALRSTLVGANRKWPLADVLSSLRDHASATRRQPTFEYVVLPGTNDLPGHARAMAGLLGDLDCTVNLIACHPAPGQVDPDPDAVRRFKVRLERFGLHVTVRKSRGKDIDAACGQLRSRLRKGSQRRDAGR